MGYTFEYKCRRCQSVKTGSSFSSSELEICNKLDRITAYQGSNMLSFHKCNDGGYGVTDLIGCRKEDNDENN